MTPPLGAPLDVAAEPALPLGFAPGLSAAGFETVRNLLRQHASLVLEPGRAYLVERRLQPLARQQGFGHVDALAEELRGQPFGPLHARVVDALTSADTAFFRDMHPFEALRAAILPDLVARRVGERRLRIWSAAAASGQEPYTVALLLCQHFPELAEWDVSILATDLSERLLERAREGRYGEHEVSGSVPTELRERWFVRVGDEWELSPEVRRRVSFERLNLAGAWPPLPCFDLVLLRNVLAYVDPEGRKRMLGRVRERLAPDGWLVLGATETTLHVDPCFERVAVERSWAYRLRSR